MWVYSGRGLPNPRSFESYFDSSLWRKGKFACESVAYQPSAYPGSYSMKRWKVFLLDGMLIHWRVIPSTRLTGTHSYTWVERHCDRKVPFPVHKIISPVRRTFRSGVAGTNHEAIARPLSLSWTVTWLFRLYIEVTCTSRKSHLERINQLSLWRSSIKRLDLPLCRLTLVRQFLLQDRYHPKQGNQKGQTSVLWALWPQNTRF